MSAHPQVLRRQTQRGFTLIELLIALLIGRFPVGRAAHDRSGQQTSVRRSEQARAIARRRAHGDDDDVGRHRVRGLLSVLEQQSFTTNPTFNSHRGSADALAVAATIHLGIYNGGAARRSDHGAHLDILPPMAAPAREHPQLQLGQSNPVGGPLAVANSFRGLERPARLHHERHAVHARRGCQRGVTQLERAVRRQGEPGATGNNVDTYMTRPRSRAESLGQVISALVS
jgi:hypothetical protein